MRLSTAHQDVLHGCALFLGIDPAAFPQLLDRLLARVIRVQPGETLLLAGDEPRFLGLMLSGQAHIYRESITGEAALIATLSRGELFAETLCLAGLPASPMTVIAHSACEYLRLPAAGFLPPASGEEEQPVCCWHIQLRTNLLRILAQKNLHLQSRMDILVAKGIREKVLRLLEPYAKIGTPFTLPLNREQMAAYLAVDRSALSHELMRMRAEGLIAYHKNQFTLFVQGIGNG